MIAKAEEDKNINYVMNPRKKKAQTQQNTN